MKYSHHQTKYIGKWVGLRTYQHPGTNNAVRWRVRLTVVTTEKQKCVPFYCC